MLGDELVGIYFPWRKLDIFVRGMFSGDTALFWLWKSYVWVHMLHPTSAEVDKMLVECEQ